MKNKLHTYLSNYKKTYINLDELINLFNNNTDYFVLAEIIKEIEKDGGIEPVKKSGYNNRAIPLSYKYRVNKQFFRQNFYNKLHKKQYEINSRISLEDYYSLNEVTYDKDETYIDLVSKYLDNNSDTKTKKYIPELSFEIVGDEKWIQEKGGETVLKRLHIWNELLFNEQIEPLSFAINPNKLSQEKHYHLIIENKTPFLYLINHINKSKYTTIIYGKGWQIISNIHLLLKQINCSGQHIYEYFGDLDHEGLSIFYSLSNKIEVKPAIHFYEEMMKYKSVNGKYNQRINEDAVDKFTTYFTEEQQNFIMKILSKKTYYPQEILNENIMSKILKDDLSDRL